MYGGCLLTLNIITPSPSCTLKIARTRSSISSAGNWSRKRGKRKAGKHLVFILKWSDVNNTNNANYSLGTNYICTKHSTHSRASIISTRSDYSIYTITPPPPARLAVAAISDPWGATADPRPHPASCCASCSADYQTKRPSNLSNCCWPPLMLPMPVRLPMPQLRVALKFRYWYKLSEIYMWTEGFVCDFDQHCRVYRRGR